ncbi:MAG TPA: DinB family protein [Candidatus Acidoferrales bacterium]|nr:DinB family protein [Candidatus Acidoferrales bacterium]
MPMRDAILNEFDHEMISTRKTLERVPEGKPDYAPHEKSMKMGRLAGHVAELSGWAATIIGQDSLDFRPLGAPPQTPTVMTSRKQLLEVFDKKAAEARAAIAGASDETLLKNWTLLSGGQAIFSMPRAAVLRSFVMNHIVHHRAQLGVYLRLNGVAVPSVYGPSADEQNFFGQ